MYEQEVLRGAKWLDEQKPGWEWDINSDILNIACSTKCILGQLFGEVEVTSKIRFEREFCVSNGFLLGNLPERFPFGLISHEAQEWSNNIYRELGLAWTREIMRRRGLVVMQEQVLAKFEVQEAVEPKGRTIHDKQEETESPRASDGQDGWKEGRHGPLERDWQPKFSQPEPIRVIYGQLSVAEEKIIRRRLPDLARERT